MGAKKTSESSEGASKRAKRAPKRKVSVADEAWTLTTEEILAKDLNLTELQQLARYKGMSVKRCLETLREALLNDEIQLDKTDPIDDYRIQMYDLVKDLGLSPAQATCDLECSNCECAHSILCKSDNN